jgi:hypothetical protein
MICGFFIIKGMIWIEVQHYRLGKIESQIGLSIINYTAISNALAIILRETVTVTLPFPSI